MKGWPIIIYCNFILFQYTATLYCDDDNLLPSNLLDAYSQLYGGRSYVKMVLDLPLSDLLVVIVIYSTAMELNTMSI